ncbi:hypothetical protein [Streptomyces chryseus]|uniref:Lipoprotein n=1 Tax=Streptomyces chryseus TaxID=68186 RepID=A0ABQ3DI68_9ACTN|nr:hypothetical protein [Streptomyces chryseus]GHA97801.1 hypothetical protein GCM10010346_20850 [Streptomyces chryseus]
MVATFPTRRRAAVFASTVLLITSLPFTLSACGSGDPPTTRQAAAEPALVPLAFGSSLTDAVADQATAQDAAARKAAARDAASEPPGSGDRRVCTTDPADRAACRNPGGTVDPDGGDLDGDGVFEPHEPVGPGYKDPRAYDGGKTSGETQCEWLRSQGIAC